MKPKPSAANKKPMATIRTSDLRFRPCVACGTQHRIVFVMADRVDTRCAWCGVIESFEKSR